MKMIEDTWGLLKNPYRFISLRCKDVGADVFETRIFLQKTFCMTGKDAAELFYNPQYFKRAKAAPEPIRATLFGKGGLQELDGIEHGHRKLMFMSLMTPQNIDELKNIFSSNLSSSLEEWLFKDKVLLYDELQRILMKSVCDWAGVPLREGEVSKRSKELTLLFDSAGEKGSGHFWARVARKNVEDWIERIVQELRAEGFEPSVKTPMEVIIWHRDLADELLSPRVAAVEILNLLRPTVAVSVFIVFMAHALHHYPTCSEKLLTYENNYADYFIDEVRRFYPFFPSVMARVKEDFHWKNIHFTKGARAILDLYGTNNDPRIWDTPEDFWPERFRNYRPNDFDFIPQGGGDVFRDHRCPGELITRELMKTALNFLLHEIDYDVPTQNLDINWSRLPAIPESRFIMTNIASKLPFMGERPTQGPAIFLS